MVTSKYKVIKQVINAPQYPLLGAYDSYRGRPYATAGWITVILGFGKRGCGVVAGRCAGT